MDGLVIHEKTIDIDASRLLNVLLQMNPNMFHGCETLSIRKYHKIGYPELMTLMSRLNKSSVRYLHMQFTKFDLLAMHSISIGYNRNCRTIKKLTLDCCDESDRFISYLFPKKPVSEPNVTYYQCRFPALTHIDIVSTETIGPSEKLLTEILKDNYRIREIDIHVGEHGEHGDVFDKHELEKTLYDYIKRNKLGYEKCIKTCITLLGLRKFRNKLSVVSILDRNVLLLICKEIFNTIGTKVWCCRKEL